MPEAGYISNKVAKNELNSNQAAKELGVTIPEWLEHYELHVRRKVMTAIANNDEVKGMANNVIDKIKEGQDSLQRLIDVTKPIYEKLKHEENQDNIKLIQAYAQLEGNVMRNLKELAVLEGEIQNSLTINYTNNVIKAEKLISVVLESAPPMYKKELLKQLDKLEIVANAN